MKNYLLTLLLITLGFCAFSQSTVTGTIIDSETKLPLEGASIFAQNTTRGTITNKEGKYSLYLPKGGYEIIISFTGYDSRKINFEAETDREFNLELSKADNSMSEVVIRSTNEVTDGWEKYGTFFLEHFIGKTAFSDSCVLLNPTALKFFYYRRNDRLKVLATEPLLIQNRSLGYNIRYELDSFVHHYKPDLSSYRGLVLYTPIEGEDSMKATWAQNRRQAYLGSRLQFMRAYYEGTLKENGYSVGIIADDGSKRFYQLENPYDTAYFFFDDSTGNAELFFPAEVSITYNKVLPEKKYLQAHGMPLNVKSQVSFVRLKEGILINPNGYFTDQGAWINSGYWSWRNVADALPYDYEE